MSRDVRPGRAAGLDEAALTGRSCDHVVTAADIGCALHADVITPLRLMRVIAWAEAGIDLVVASGFRDFDRQLAIWNAKMRGERPVLDRHGDPVDTLSLDLDARIDAVLLWSALPGASRHHWGTDLDVIDAAGMPPGYRPQLVALEYGPEGPFGALSHWLTANLQRFGFFRPYARDRGGVQPEPWHLSYAPVAMEAIERLTVERLAAALRDAPMEGRERVLERLPELHERYVLRFDPPPG